MITVDLERTNSGEHQTLGKLIVGSEEFATMELPWLDNQRSISCIPCGIYEVVWQKSPKFGWCWHITNVPNRSRILIHKGNYNRDTLGCILPGIYHKDLDNDGLKDVGGSTAAFKRLKEILPNKFKLQIYGA